MGREYGNVYCDRWDEPWIEVGFEGLTVVPVALRVNNLRGANWERIDSARGGPRDGERRVEGGRGEGGPTASNSLLLSLGGDVNCSRVRVRSVGAVPVSRQRMDHPAKILWGYFTLELYGTAYAAS